MKNKLFLSLCRVSILFLFCVGICICLWWYPLSISFCTVGLVSGESVPVEHAREVACWVQLLFAYLASVPCFVVLALGFRATVYAGRDEFFTKKNALLFKVIAIMLFVDSIVFIIGNMVFMFLGWNPFASLYYVIGVIGMIFALGSYFSYRYLEKAIAIKEENDSIL